MNYETQCVMAVQGYPKSLILAPIESAYALPISHHSSIATLVLFQRYCRFSAKTTSHPIPPEFWGCSLELDCRCWGSEERRPYNMLITRVITFDTTTVHQRHRRTDGQTTYDSSTALCTMCIVR